MSGQVGESGQGRPAYDPPGPLRPGHDLAGFDSGEPALDDWLRRRARRSEADGSARTYVVCPAGSPRVAGYFSLAAGSVARASAPGKVRRNAPDPVPVVVLARLAVDVTEQGRGIGRGLLRDAVLRTANAAGIAGVRALLTHAISERAAGFYERAGFRPSPVDPRTLMLPIAETERVANTADSR